LDAKKRFIEDNKRALDELGIAINNVKDAEFFFIGQTDDYIAAMRDRAKAEAAMKAAGKYYEKAALAQAEADSRGAKGEALSETYTNETSLFGQWVLGKDKYEVITKPTERGKLATEAQEYNNQGDALFRLAQSYEEAASAKYKFQTTGTGGGSSSSKSFTPGAFKPSADPTMERGAFDWSYAGAVDAGAEMEKLKATMAARAQMANASAEERKAIEERLSQELATIEELRLMNHEIILESMLQEDWLSFDERTEIELELTRVKEEQTALRLEAEEERAAKEKQILDQEAKEDEKRKKDRMKAASALASATSNILNSMADMAEEDSKKQKALRAAAIVMDTFQASMAGWTSAQSLMPPANFIVGAANVAASVAMGIAQLKGLQNTAHDGSNASGALSSAQSAPSVASSMPASYTRNLQGDNELTEMNKDTRVYVVESDITEAQNNAKARVESASF
jgi:hypothetical protein